MGEHLRPLTTEERRANLLAGLDEAPSALTGWHGFLEVAYELGGHRPLRYSIRGRGITPRSIRLSRAWRPIASARLARQVEHMKEAVNRAGEAIRAAFASLVFPPVKMGVLTQADVELDA